MIKLFKYYLLRGVFFTKSRNFLCQSVTTTQVSFFSEKNFLISELVAALSVNTWLLLQAYSLTRKKSILKIIKTNNKTQANNTKTHHKKKMRNRGY